MAKIVNCRDCSTPMPHTARFCPRCGRAAHDSPRADAAPVVNLATVKSPIPRLGILFLIALILGPVVAILGLYFGSFTLLWCAAALIGFVLLLMVLGIFL